MTQKSAPAPSTFALMAESAEQAIPCCDLPLEQRVEALEKNRAEIREDWKAARERIERYLKGQ